MQEHKLGGQAVIVGHGVVQGQPILRATCDEPVEAADSGWAFYAAFDSNDTDGAQVWSLSDIMIIEPSLAPHLRLLPGAVLERTAAGEAWQQIAGLLPSRFET